MSEAVSSPAEPALIENILSALKEKTFAWLKESASVSSDWEIGLPPSGVDSDFSISWALGLAKELHRSPMEVAKELALVFEKIPGVKKAQPCPPGFINLKLDLEILTKNLKLFLKTPASYGRQTKESSRSILIEFVSANPTGPLHLASGRGATLGDSLARILKRRGHKIGTEYYVNDCGNQVDKLGLSLKARRMGEEVPEDGYHGDYIKDLALSFPKEADAWTPQQFSKEGLETLLKTHQRDMKNFGVRFDRWYLESELHSKGALDHVLGQLKERGMVYQKDGATWLGTGQVEGVEDDKDRVLIKAGGQPTYFLADAAYHLDKYKRGFSELIDILGADHHGYVGRLKASVAALGYSPDSCHIIIHQLVHLFRSGKPVRMSKRAGEFITLKELIDEVGVDACRFFFAMRAPQTHLQFDIDLAKKKSSENPVFYCQYVHARIASLFREAASHGFAEKLETFDDKEAALLNAPEERLLLVKIAWFWMVLKSCEKELSPHLLASYLIELARLFHSFYEKHRVVDAQAPEVSRARLFLCAGVKTAIKEGLDLLGVSAPEQM